jgi:hypothetical protein
MMEEWIVYQGNLHIVDSVGVPANPETLPTVRSSWPHV